MTIIDIKQNIYAFKENFDLLIDDYNYLDSTNIERIKLIIKKAKSYKQSAITIKCYLQNYNYNDYIDLLDCIIIKLSEIITNSKLMIKFMN